MGSRQRHRLWGLSVVTVALSLPVTLELLHELRAAEQMQGALGGAQCVRAVFFQHLYSIACMYSIDYMYIA